MSAQFDLHQSSSTSRSTLCGIAVSVHETFDRDLVAKDPEADLPFCSAQVICTEKSFHIRKARTLKSRAPSSAKADTVRNQFRRHLRDCTQLLQERHYSAKPFNIGPTTAFGVIQRKTVCVPSWLSGFYAEAHSKELFTAGFVRRICPFFKHYA